MSNESMVARASRGELTKSELERIALGVSNGSVDTYTGILALGRAGARQYRSLVEGYLQSPENPMLARLALQVLCRYWGFGVEYASVIETFIRGVEWDSADDVRLMAIDCAGDLLAHTQSMSLYSLLLEIFRNVGERQIVREAAYCSLAIARGKALLDLPPASRHFDLEKDIDPRVIAEVEALLRSA